MASPAQHIADSARIPNRLNDNASLRPALFRGRPTPLFWDDAASKSATACPLCPSFRVYCCTAVSEVMGQSTKSLRDSGGEAGLRRMNEVGHRR
jgi:hypothetical protein